MRKFLLGSICAASLAVAGAVAAQPGQPVTPQPVVQPVPHASPMRIAQPQTRTAVIDKVRQHFARLDTDRDGYLTKAEAQAGRAAIKARRGQMAGRRAHGQRDHGAMFERLDTNRDGTLAPEERQQMRTRMKEMHRVTRPS